ncbi:hypothetical protein Daus18300_003071 [Diaporthe australafricana]|uniref:RRM domain-containing protein n=1 Tax=Diaporthe australafricana TaxID=127596 RepID=A0ABR3XJL9_9PEZI
MSEKPGQHGRMVQNPAWREDFPMVMENKNVPKNRLECVYPVQMDDGSWKWVLTPTQDRKLPFLSDNSSNYSDAWRVILNSKGNWVGISEDGAFLPIPFENHPEQNVLYSDYGYHPDCSPYRHRDGTTSEFTLTPQQVNPQNYRHQQQPSQSRANSAVQTNTTLFIGGLDESIDDGALRTLFGGFGEVTYMNLTQERCGFVQFVKRRDAQMAMRQMQGVAVNSIRLRISWGDPRMRDQSEFRPRHVDASANFQNNNWRQGPPQQGQQWRQQQPQQWPQHGPQANHGWQHMPPNFISRPQPQQNPWHQQQPPNGMPQGQGPSSGNNGWYPGHGPRHQPAGPQHYWQSPTQPAGPQETVPQGTQNGEPSRLNPRAASWEGNTKGKAPLVGPSDMAPSPEAQQLRPDDKDLKEEVHDKSTSPVAGHISPAENKSPAGNSSSSENKSAAESKSSAKTTPEK